MLILQVCIWRHNGTVDHSTTDLELTVAFDTCRCEVVSCNEPQSLPAK